MKAIYQTGYGGPEKFVSLDAQQPSPGHGELLVQVAAAGLNPVDYKMREGKLRRVFSTKLPFIAGNELSGEIVAIGSGVTGFVVGDQIIARQKRDTYGAFADFTTVAQSVAAIAPTAIPLTDASGLSLGGQTALQALRDILKIGPGKHVLITGGAGGVGTLAIQIAKALGAEVTTTASPRGKALVESLGADHVIDYTTTDLATVQTRFDGVFDLVAGDALEAAFTIAKPGTTVVSISAVPDPVSGREDIDAGFLLRFAFAIASHGLRKRAKKNGVTYRFLFVKPNTKDLSTLVDMVNAGKLRVIVDSRFSFENFHAAMAQLEKGRAKGKILVEM